MSQRPWNLALRFALEVTALAAFGWSAWTLGSGPIRFVLVVVAVAVPAAIWAIFRVPNDGGRPIVTVPGIVRLAIETDYFGAAVALLAVAGAVLPAVLLGGLVLAHYLLSWDRIARLLANSPLAPGAPFGAPPRS